MSHVTFGTYLNNKEYPCLYEIQIELDLLYFYLPNLVSLRWVLGLVVKLPLVMSAPQL